MSSTLDTNALGRAWVFLMLLAPYRRLTLMGRSSGNRWTLFPLPAGVDVIDLGRAALPPRDVRRLLAETPAIVVKPLWSSLGFRLLTKSAAPWILDIDDPEMALRTPHPRAAVRSLLSLDGGTLPLMAWLTTRARTRTVASRALQERYGGTIIPHARDAAPLTMAVTGGRRAARQALGLDDQTPLTVWHGSPRPHKGLDVLLKAAPRVPGRVALVGVSAEERPRLLGQIRGEAPTNVVVVPPVPHQEVIRWIAAADVVVVPQLDGRVARFQAPAKLSDTLGIGRAVVASDLPPIREIVGDAGILIPPGSADALASAVAFLLTDRDAREALESSARSRFLEHLSADAVRPTLLRLLDQIAA